MPKLIPAPTIVEAAGTRPKKIEDFVGCVNTDNENVSVARMKSPEGWAEPGQKPEFEEVSVVLSGILKAEFEGGTLEAGPGQTIVSKPGEWVRYSTPNGAEYIAVCVPAFSPAIVHRDE